MEENTDVINKNEIPEEYQPLSIGAFIGYQLLFTMPCVGFIIAIVFACGGVKNKNLINWARAQLIVLGIILIIYVFILFLAFGLRIFNSTI